MAPGEPFDAAALVAAPWTETQQVAHNRRDCIAYALGIGSTDMRFCYENHERFAPYPWFPVVFTHKGRDTDVSAFPSASNAVLRDTSAIPAAKRGAGGVLAETQLEMARALPLEAAMGLRSRVRGVHDKGKGCLVEHELGKPPASLAEHGCEPLCLPPGWTRGRSCICWS